jgi:hypothetical protein
MLKLVHPPSYQPERRYIYDLLFRSLLGLAYYEENGPPGEVTVTLDGDSSGGRLRVVDTLFSVPEEQWLSSALLPARPLPSFRPQFDGIEKFLVHPMLPVVFGAELADGNFLQVRSDGIDLGVDLFGTAFFLLSRYEEVTSQARDNKDRFPPGASLAVREGFLDRPLVNEYLELLWACLQVLWPRLERAPRSFKVVLGHDVDVPLIAGGMTWWETLRGASGDLFKRRDLPLAKGRIRSMVENRRGNFDADICNSFDFILQTSERLGLPSTFFFIAGHSGGKVDGTYSLEDPWIRKLLRKVGQRGHDIGFHPSYNTYLDRQQLEREFIDLRHIAEMEGIAQSTWGGRQHHLRWRAPTTWQLYEDVGLYFDATLAYPDRAGFRSGTCDPYPVFNLHTRKALRLVEQPLIVMDEALLGHGRVPLEIVRATVLRYKERCRKIGGTFSILWHNGWLISEQEKALYLDILEA